jgi:anthranilate synthase component 1
MIDKNVYGEEVAAFELDTVPDALEAYVGVRDDIDETGYTCLLESADTFSSPIPDDAEPAHEEDGGFRDRARYSYIGFDPIGEVEVGNGEASFQPLSGEEDDLDFGDVVDDQGQIKEGYGPEDALREGLNSFDTDIGELAEREELPGFFAGYVGGHPFEFFYESEDFSENSQLPPEGDIPTSEFAVYDKILAYDHQEDSVRFIKTDLTDDSDFVENAEAEANQISEYLSGLDKEIPKGIEIDEYFEPDGEDFMEAVKTCRDHVRDGDIYQAVPRRKKEFTAQGDPVALYRILREMEPTPYMYLTEHCEDVAFGSSPETIVRVEGDEVVTNPIAGTTRRGEDLEQDKKLAQALLNDEKERAEHRMLVDLGINDVRGISVPGKANVDEFMKIVRYSEVQHIESEVSSLLRPGKDAFDAVKATHPAGTLVGAPKQRAAEIIYQLEDDYRGMYGGAIGYHGIDGNSDLAIGIRSIFGTQDQDTGEMKLNLQAGAGIVYDSDPESELEETENKLATLEEVINQASNGELEAMKR